MRKLVIFHYFLLSWPLLSRPAHTTYISSPLASPPLAELDLPSTRRIKDDFQKSFPLSRALRPFPSISSTLRPFPSKKPTPKLIQAPKGDFMPIFVLDLTQAEFSRQQWKHIEEGRCSWYDHDDLIPTPRMVLMDSDWFDSLLANITKTL